MKKFKKVLSVLLAIITVVTTCSVAMPVLAQTVLESSKKVNEEIVVQEEMTSKIIDEVIELREEKTKYYICEDGSYIAASYSEPIHYEVNGEWKEIDNSLTLVTDNKKGLDNSVYKTLSGTVDISIPQSFDGGKKIYLSNKGYEISFGVSQDNQLGNSKTAKVVEDIESLSSNIDSSSIKIAKADSIDGKITAYNNEIMSVKNQVGALVFADAFLNADLEYIVSSNSIKESIVVKGKQDTYLYNFDMNFGELIPVICEDNSIKLVSKTSNGVTTKFYLDGTNIIEQADDTTTLYFFYDSVGEIIGFKYNGNNYLYLKNSMGDIVGIADASGNLIASYTYDAWGKVTSVTGSNTAIGERNPFRYRSYYYDSDIQMYYLQSRYYDPEIGRFISSDDMNYLGISEVDISYNAFVYCDNNPINDCDYSGHFSMKEVTEIINKIVSRIVDICNFLLDKYKVSKKRYLKTTKYNTPNKIYAYVNNNKNKIKGVKNNLSSVATCLGLVLDIIAVSSILTQNKNATLAVAEIIFYGLIRVLSYSGSKLVELIVTNIAKPLVVLKYAVKAILDFAIEKFLSSRYIEKIKSGYMKNINVKNFTFGNCLSALFKGTKSIFA